MAQAQAQIGSTQRTILDVLPKEPDRMSADLVAMRLNSKHGYNISENAVRAALRRLANRGLVTVQEPIRGLGLPFTYARHEHSP